MHVSFQRCVLFSGRASQIFVNVFTADTAFFCPSTRFEPTMQKARHLQFLRRLASVIFVLMVVKLIGEQKCEKKRPLSVSISAQAAMSEGKGSQSHKRKRIRHEMTDALSEEGGVCGSIVRSMKIPCKDGGSVDWTYMDPCALLRALSKFGDLLKNVETQRLCVYMDEVTPGNVLRPDRGRSVAMWYWTLLDLPDWFMGRSDGWFYFAALPVKLIDGIQDGYSYLFGRMMEIFLEQEGPFNFTTRFPCNSSRGMFLCKGKFEALLSDEKSITALWSLRGASGTKPCCFCQNVLGHMAPDKVEDHAWLVHYSCSSSKRFAKHTTRTFSDMREKLEAISGNKTACQKLGQVFGLTFKANGILWHPTLRHKVCPIQQTVYDWMHILVASGGVLQYECNEYVKVLKGEGILPEQLDAFAVHVCFPKKFQKLPKKFFQERVNWEDNSVLRAFAGEILMVVPTLVFFNEIVLKRLGILQDHRESLQLAADILDILFCGVESLQFQRELKRKIARHNDLFAQLYSGCVKPKFHWLFHVPEHIAKIGRSLACFSAERKHRAAKTVAAFNTQNDKVQLNLATRVGDDTLKGFSDKTVCQETFLLGTGKDAPQWEGLLELQLGKRVSAVCGRKLMSSKGEVSLQDAVWDREQGQLLFPTMFLQVTDVLSRRQTFMCVAQCHNHAGNGMFEAVSSEDLLVWKSEFQTVPYTKRSRGMIHALLK